MLDYETYKLKVLYLLYDWVLSNNDNDSSVVDNDQFLNNPVVNKHIITDEEIRNSYDNSISFCTEKTMKPLEDLPVLAIVYKGASILWLRCNKYVDTRDETGNYIVSYGDYLDKECNKLLHHYLPYTIVGLRCFDE